MAYSKAKLESSGNKASPLFQIILNRKHVRQMLAYADSAVALIQAHFYQPLSFMGIPNSMRMLYKTSLLPKS